MVGENLKFTILKYLKMHFGMKIIHHQTSHRDFNLKIQDHRTKIGRFWEVLEEFGGVWRSFGRIWEVLGVLGGVLGGFGRFWEDLEEFGGVWRSFGRFWEVLGGS